MYHWSMDGWSFSHKYWAAGECSSRTFATKSIDIRRKRKEKKSLQSEIVKFSLHIWWPWCLCISVIWNRRMNLPQVNEKVNAPYIKMKSHLWHQHCSSTKNWEKVAWRHVLDPLVTLKERVTANQYRFIPSDQLYSRMKNFQPDGSAFSRIKCSH